MTMPKVTMKNSDGTTKTLDIKQGEVLFDAFEDLGLELRHGCLSGSCGTCKINILENPAGLKEAGAIEQDTLDSIKETASQHLGKDQVASLNLRLACRAKVNSDFTFEPFELKKK